ncbi:hypothetical protein BDN70DRAFT_937636 [Pholiota conissans]|uniref:Uncharacterized protein n=1 Tax=Pholiota conissans TaxID=109636 RepID=A0A9P6CNS5_9AGAR|nr:hypothetical protein BDN70DRAFT_937636 [Pholiota conissans]
MVTLTKATSTGCGLLACLRIANGSKWLATTAGTAFQILLLLSGTRVEEVYRVWVIEHTQSGLGSAPAYDENKAASCMLRDVTQTTIDESQF